MTDKNDQNLMLRNIQNPSKLMRARHPDLFSDSRIDETPELPKAVFEYYLETLTSRKQEYQFEHFCRKLAEKEICPNLRVQTGPTGGGDSKVDAETYPVAKEISERWWIGSTSAGDERWAFAFSAKKAWKPKVKADVNNILSTDRDYKRIYFFTNQFVSDKERSKHEDKLSKQTGIPIHIFDRAWIVERVYEADHLDLAIAALGIEDAKSKKVSQAGPLDLARQIELKELDSQVADSSRYLGARFQLVEDCLRTAILARGLERPRNEVDSRFALADRLAQELGFSNQRLRVAYDRAWTAYWWYEDYASFGRYYEEVEMLAKDSNQAGEVELLQNLWTLLTPLVATGNISIQDAAIEPRRLRLTSILEAIAADPARLNNALQARTSLTLLRITQACQIESLNQLESCWEELSEIVDESTNLGAYPIERLSDLVTMFGEQFDGLAFDMLYEKIVGVIRTRRSEGAAGEAYIERGVQKLRQEKPYEAIKWFGRAEDLLIKDEYRAELVMSLIASSYAYERVGLLWAARNKVLAAVERTLAVFNEQGKVIPPALSSVKRLGWIELQLGRIPHVLSAMTLTNFVASHLKLSGNRLEAYVEEMQMQDNVLGIHFLNLSVDALSGVSRLPDTLERLGLNSSRMALLFALGQEQVLNDEGAIPTGNTPDDVKTFFELWQDQPAAKDIPPQPLLMDGPTSILQSTILGVNILVEIANNPVSFGVAESLLGVMEAFLATSEEADVMPHCEQIKITVTPSVALTGTPQLHLNDDGINTANIEHPADVNFKTAAERQEYMQWLHDCIGQILPRMLIIRDVGAWFEKIAGQERGFSRALTHGDVLTLERNVFNELPAIRLTDWLASSGHTYPALRVKPWRVTKIDDPFEAREDLKFGDGPPPPELTDNSQLKHTDRGILSPIDMALWDRAKWRATLFVYVQSSIPLLAIAFENGEAGQAIFRAWIERWGRKDEEDILRLAFITGLSRQNPAEYAVVVGPNISHIKHCDGKRFVLVSRINRMTPTSSTNLDNFLAAYQRAGSFLLAPAQMDSSAPVPFVHLSITKRDLHIRRAWQIGENDPDASALHEDDEPIIPIGMTDPPVNKALVQLRSFRRS